MPSILRPLTWLSLQVRLGGKKGGKRCNSDLENLSISSNVIEKDLWHGNLNCTEFSTDICTWISIIQNSNLNFSNILPSGRAVPKTLKIICCGRIEDCLKQFAISKKCPVLFLPLENLVVLFDVIVLKKMWGNLCKQNKMSYLKTLKSEGYHTCLGLSIKLIVFAWFLNLVFIS